MPRINRFRAIHYPRSADLRRVSAPPYDVIAPDEQVRLAESDPHNLINVTLGLEEPADTDESNRYTRAAARWRSWLEAGVLVEDPEPSLYLYRADFATDGRPGTTAGIIASLELEELGSGTVFGHERTRPGPKADRLALMRTTRANLEPLWFFASGAMSGFTALVEDLENHDPLGDVTDEQEVRHRVWRLTPDRGRHFTDILSRIPLVVADGHHRYETAVTYRDERRAQDGNGPWDQTMVLVSDPEQYAPELLPIHRLVTGLDPEAIDGLQPLDGSVEDLENAVRNAGPGTIGVARDGSCWTLSSAGDVDTVWLAETIVDPAGCDVTYEHNMRIIKEALADGGTTAFIMAAAPVGVVAEKALAGERLPPKTTLFWPKPRSGLLMRDLDPAT